MTIKLAAPLMALMALTRFHHFGDAFSLPDASLAIFFLAGLLQARRWWLFIALLAEAALIDYLAITQFNVSAFCISPAYIFLVPAYAVIWFAGRYCVKFSSLELSELSKTIVALFLGITGAFLISNGSFYLLSGRNVELSWTNYLNGVMQYYPPYLFATLIYGVLGLIIIKLFKAIPVLSQHNAA